MAALPLEAIELTQFPPSGEQVLPLKQVRHPNDEKLTGVFKRTVNSPLFWATISTAALIAFSAVSITVSVYATPVAVIGVIALAILMYKKRDMLWYEISLLAVVFIGNTPNHPYHNVVDEGDHTVGKLHLSMIPLRNMGHDTHLPEKLQVGAVCAVLQPFEAYSDSIMSEPVRPETWEKKKVSYKRIEVYDLNPLSDEQLDEGADFIWEHTAKKINALVHCKAGRGRSASVVVAYLLKYRSSLFRNENESHDTEAERRKYVERVIKHVRTKRPVMDLSASQKKALFSYYEYLQQPLDIRPSELLIL